jgi:predicted ATP-binding protein involved in virulence
MPKPEIDINSFGIQLRLDRMALMNFRPFKGDFLLTFPEEERLLVLIGSNGAGKTSVLDGMVWGLRYLEHQFLSAYDVQSPFERKGRWLNRDIHNGEDRAVFKHFFRWTEHAEDYMGIQHTDPYALGFEMAMERNTSLQMEGFLTDKSLVEDEEEEESIDFATSKEPDEPERDETNKFENRLREIQVMFRADKLTFLPVMVYYACNSIGIELDDEQLTPEDANPTLFSTYKGALDGKRFDFREFYRWYDRQQRFQLQGRANLIAPINEAVSQMLSDPESEPPRIYRNLRLEWIPAQDSMRIEKVEGEDVHDLDVAQLSSGEKTLLALVADLARRLAIANPTAENPLHGNGIVLIDEIDVHLHPGWQRKVVPKLLDIFPKVQFVVTTHSPVILTEIASKHIRILDEGQVYGAEESLGRKVDYSLSVLMGYKPDIRSEFEEISELIAQDHVEKAEEALNKMVERINREGDKGEDIPEVINLRKLIKRKRVLSNP